MTRIKLRYVNEFIDRHGKPRYYFRRLGECPGRHCSLRRLAAPLGALQSFSSSKSQCFVSHILGCAVLPIFLDNCPTAAFHGSSSSLERTRVVERSTREPGRSTPAED